MIIAIDGPAASGKSTIARLLAQELHYFYLNSGMLYRALSYYLLYYKEALLEELSSMPIDKVEQLHYTYDQQEGFKVLLGTVDITACLKTPLIDKAASLLGENMHIRHYLVEEQRTLVNHYNAVVEGRDTGSVVFPHAFIKFFLTADESVRAHRWLQEQYDEGNTKATFDQALQDIQERDCRDAKRVHAPLRLFVDSVIIDSSCLTIAQTLALLMSIITYKQKREETISSLKFC